MHAGSLPQWENIKINIKTLNLKRLHKIFSWPDEVIVMAGSAIGLLLFELLFKWKIIFSHSFILDDAFMFERAIHNRPFNDLSKFLPDFLSVNFDGFLILSFYRSLVTLSGGIISLRLIFLFLFALTASLFSLLIYRVTKERNFSIFAGLFSLISPFSFIFVLFTNASYYLIFLIILTLGLISGTYIKHEKSVVKTSLLIVLMTGLFFLSTALLAVGFLICIPAMFWVFIYSKSFLKVYTKRLFLICGTILLVQAAWVVFNVTSPYSALPGRINYDFYSMLLNGLSIINRSISTYLSSQVSIGTPTLQNDLRLAGVFIFFIVWLHILMIYRIVRSGEYFSPETLKYSFALLLSVLVVMCIGPYSALTITHPWNYFPPLLFISSMTFLLIRFSFGKPLAYLAIFFATIFTAQSYRVQAPTYFEAINQQERLTNFIRSETAGWRLSDRIYLILTEEKTLHGFNAAFRSTAFNRYVSNNPNAPYLNIVDNKLPSGVLGHSEPGVVIVYKMNKTGEFERLK